MAQMVSLNSARPGQSSIASGAGIVAAGPDATWASGTEGIVRIDSGGVTAEDAVLPTIRVVRRGQHETRMTPVPHAIASDSAGNLFVADPEANVVRRIDAASGKISIVAGSGLRGYAGDGGSATAALLDDPTALALDSAGNLFIAEGTLTWNNRIRRVDGRTGLITTFAGTGTAGFSGDGGAAGQAQFRSNGSIVVDRAGNLYIADNRNNRIRRVDAGTGLMETVAGTGISGSGGDGSRATEAELNNPLGLALDREGNLYIADTGNFRIRRVDAGTGMISTLAADGLRYPDDLHGAPFALAVDAQNRLVVADLGTSTLRMVPLSSVTATLGTATPGTARTLSSTGGFTIQATYDSTVPAAAQTAYSNFVTAYEGLFSSPLTISVSVVFGNTGLGSSYTEYTYASYSAVRSALAAMSAANPSNTYLATALTTLPATDPLGKGNVILSLPHARLLGFSATPQGPDSIITFTNSPNTWEYTGTGNRNFWDFGDTAAHETDEVMGMNSSIEPGTLPTDFYALEDYFRYGANGQRLISNTNSDAVYFSYDGGKTDVVRFNNDPNVGDMHDFWYGDNGCPAKSPGPYYQDAYACNGDAVGIHRGSPEMTILQVLGYVMTPGTGSAQTITFNSLPGMPYGTAPFALAATASSGLAVTYTSGTTTVCTVSGTTITIVGAGSCSVTASQGGNTSFLAAASVTVTFTVTQASQTITFNPLSSVAAGSAPITISATASSGLAVSFTSTTVGVCTVSGNKVTIVATGTCTVVAAQGGNTNYTAAPGVTQSFTVLPSGQPQAQTISFGPLNSSAVGVVTSLLAQASSGLAVSFTSNTPNVCTVGSANTITAVATGACSVTASQNGNSLYSAATPVTSAFTVNPQGWPAVYNGGVVPLYSSVTTIQPNNWSSIYGANLAPATATWNGNFATTLGGVTVTVNGKPAPLLYVSSTLIDFQAPNDSTTGQVNVIVTTPTGSSTSYVTLAPAEPSLLMQGDGVHALVTAAPLSGSGNTGGGYDVIEPSRPARTGDYVTVWCIGLGPVSPAVPAGAAFSGSAPILDSLAISIGGIAIPQVNILYAGETGAGLYQVNVQIPSGLGVGDKQVRFTIAATGSAGVSNPSGQTITLNAP